MAVMKCNTRNPTNNHAARFVRLGRISDQVATLKKKVLRLELLSLLFYLPAMTPDNSTPDCSVSTYEPYDDTSGLFHVAN